MHLPWLTEDQVRNYGLWLQSGAISLTLLGVVISSSVNRGIARRRATLDLIMDEQKICILIDIRKSFLALKNADHLVKWADPSQAASDEAATLRSMLNRYELIAIGIKENTLNGRVYKRYSRTTVVTDWIACKPFITERRRITKTPAYYCEFESLAKKWASKDERKHC